MTPGCDDDDDIDEPLNIQNQHCVVEGIEPTRRLCRAVEASKSLLYFSSSSSFFKTTS